jgi:Bax protein
MKKRIVTLDTRGSRQGRTTDAGAPGYAPLIAGAGLALAVLALAIGLPARERIPDFRVYEAGTARKSAFFDFVRPLIEAENRHVLEDRRHLEALAHEADHGWLERWWLARLAEEYRLEPDELESDELIDALLLRVDAVPVSLALAQAAKESGWGTSRFARQGNNLFGEWCFEPGCGLVPQGRGKGRSYEVEAFASPEDAVASYVRNVNTHDAYRGFRRERARLRAAGQPLSGLRLANELGHYSVRREEYVNEVKRMIIVNDLEERPGSAGG